MSVVHPILVDRLAIVNRSVRQYEQAVAPEHISKAEAEELMRLAEQPNMGLTQDEIFLLAGRNAPGVVPTSKAIHLNRQDSTSIGRLAKKGLIRFTFRVGPTGKDIVAEASISPVGVDLIAVRMLVLNELRIFGDL